MSQPGRAKRAVGGAVYALLTVLWLSAMAVAAYMMFAAAMQEWAASYSGRDEDASARATMWMLVLCALAVGGPTLIAVVAAFRGQKAIAIVMGVLSLVLAVPALYLGAAAYEGRPKPAPTPFRYEHGCVDRSGGNGECPGG